MTKGLDATNLKHELRDTVQCHAQCPPLVHVLGPACVVRPPTAYGPSCYRAQLTEHHTPTSIALQQTRAIGAEHIYIYAMCAEHIYHLCCRCSTSLMTIRWENSVSSKQLGMFLLHASHRMHSCDRQCSHSTQRNQCGQSLHNCPDPTSPCRICSRPTMFTWPCLATPMYARCLEAFHKMPHGTSSWTSTYLMKFLDKHFSTKNGVMGR